MKIIKKSEFDFEGEAPSQYALEVQIGHLLVGAREAGADWSTIVSAIETSKRKAIQNMQLEPMIANGQARIVDIPIEQIEIQGRCDG